VSGFNVGLISWSGLPNRLSGQRQSGYKRLRLFKPHGGAEKQACWSLSLILGLSGRFSLGRAGLGFRRDRHSLFNKMASQRMSRIRRQIQDNIQIHRVSKNVPPLTCYSLDIINPITIIFGKSVTEKVRNQIMLCFPVSPL